LLIEEKFPVGSDVKNLIEEDELVKRSQKLSALLRSRRLPNRTLTQPKLSKRSILTKLMSNFTLRWAIVLLNNAKRHVRLRDKLTPKWLGPDKISEK
jgi:hypothetical protein